MSSGRGIAVAAMALLVTGCAAAQPTLPPRPEGAELEQELEQALCQQLELAEPGVS